MRKQKLQLEGKQYGPIQVIGKGWKPRYWKCRCKCGREFDARGSRLKAGKVRCQCKKAKHGHTAGGMPSPTYQSWRTMKARCKNTQCPSHGAVGITYDPRWESFKNFLADMHERPEGTSLDRVNPFGNYCKDNCRWASATTQANNKRDTRLLRYEWKVGERFGGTLASVAEWARYLRTLTGRPAWTPRRLESVLRLMQLDEILKASGPFGLAPEEWDVTIHNQFRDMFSDYLEAVYLQAA